MVALLARQKDRADQLRRSIAELRRGADEARTAALQSRRLAAAREELLDELARQEADGALSRDEVDEKLATADREAAAHLRNADARERSAAIHERDLAGLEAELGELLAELRVAELRKAITHEESAATAAVKAIEQAAAAATAFAEARAASSDLEAELEAELAGVEVDWPDGAEKPDLPFTIWADQVAPNDSVYDVARSDAVILINRGRPLIQRVRVPAELRALIDLIAG